MYISFFCDHLIHAEVKMIEAKIYTTKKRQTLVLVSSNKFIMKYKTHTHTHTLVYWSALHNGLILFFLNVKKY